MDNLKLFKVLSDKSRLLILNSLLEESMVVERLASRLGLATSTVSFHLKKLEDAGLVTSEKEQYYRQYSINKEILDQSLKDMVTMDIDPGTADREEAYRDKVIHAFFKHGRVVQLPVQKKKRLIVLGEIAKAFKKDKAYEESEVNSILSDYHDDHCTLRRDLVGFGFMTREKGIYRKC